MAQTKTPYFGKQVEESIVNYIKCKDTIKKKQIFIEKIKPAFDKLVENIINYRRFNFKELNNYYILHAETLSYLYEKLDTFNYNRISIKTKEKVKAFSYFQTVAKNFLVQMSILKRKEQNIMISDFKNDSENEYQTQEYLDNIEVINEDSSNETKEFLTVLASYLKKNKDKYKNENECKILEAIVYFLENSNKINIYNKKHLFLLLREYTGLNNKKINFVLNEIKKDYIEIHRKYYNNQI
jgi:hypothetical protein